jgi:hypothetical protein
MHTNDATRATAEAINTSIADLSADAILKAISAYQLAIADYEANCPSDNDGADAYAEISYVPAMKAIEGWEGPASTRAGAVAALEMAMEELSNFASSDMVPPLVSAALGYLKGAEDNAPTLQDVIDLYLVAQQKYRDADPDGDCEVPEWAAYEAADTAVIAFPCMSLDDVRLKARFVLDNDSPYDSVQNCTIGPEGEDVLRLFLRSLLGRDAS